MKDTFGDQVFRIITSSKFKDRVNHRHTTIMHWNNAQSKRTRSEINCNKYVGVWKQKSRNDISYMASILNSIPPVFSAKYRNWYRIDELKCTLISSPLVSNCILSKAIRFQQINYLHIIEKNVVKWTYEESIYEREGCVN